MKVEVYALLLRINNACAEIIAALAELRKHAAFNAQELERFSALVKESRASMNSYLTNRIETSGTAEAGRRYRKRRTEEKHEDL